MSIELNSCSLVSYIVYLGVMPHCYVVVSYGFNYRIGFPPRVVAKMAIWVTHIGFGSHVVTGSRSACAPSLMFESHDPPIAFFGPGWGGAHLWVSGLLRESPPLVWSPYGHAQGMVAMRVCPLLHPVTEQITVPGGIS